MTEVPQTNGADGWHPRSDATLIGYGTAEPLLGPLRNLVLSTLSGPDFKQRFLNSKALPSPADNGISAFQDRSEALQSALLRPHGLNIHEMVVAYSNDPLCRLALLHAAGQAIGAKWTSGDLDFLRVTTAFSRLQTCLRQLPDNAPAHNHYGRAPRITLVLPHREQHHFAAHLLEEHFRVRGWQTSVLRQSDNKKGFGRHLRRVPSDVYCLSWSTSALENEVLDLAAAIHQSSKGRALLIAGGPAALEKSCALFQRGIDNVFSNTYLAMEHAERYVLKTNQ
ncbi:MAG: hypothetical protein JJ902_14515 [Roseibium sp.]|nr:hypothetical protein [Roseibium sp.]